MKRLKIFSVRFGCIMALGLVLISCNVVGGKSAMVGRWSLVEGPTYGNPEEMELLSDGTGVTDNVPATWKVKNSRFYLTPSRGQYNAAAWSYKVSGATLSLTADNGTILKYKKE
jgi:hypothetical protein